VRGVQAGMELVGAVATKQRDATTRLPPGFSSRVGAFGNPVIRWDVRGWSAHLPFGVGLGATCRVGSPPYDGFTVAGNWLVYRDGGFDLGGRGEDGPGMPPFLTMSGIGLGTLCPLDI
jgi:hypothetical protein